MSSRALRKAQREREEQERTGRLEQEEEETSEAEDVPGLPSKKSAFAMLGEKENDGEDSDDEAEEQRDGHVEAELEPPREPTTTSKPKASSKKKKKRKKGKSGNDTPGKDHAEKTEQLDEIDRALKQLSTNGDASLPGTTIAGIGATTEESCKLLAIDTNHLHAQNEMRRLFGRTALEQQDNDQAPPDANIGGNRRQQRRVQQVGLAQALRGQGGHGGRAGGLAAMALRRNIFIQGKYEWPIATGGGLGMEIEEKRADGTVLYRFVHNRVYQDVQRQFQMAVESMDPERLVVLLQHNSYHISTLLQVSEIAKQDCDHATSGDLLERALFSFGRTVHSTFAKNVSEGKARLDFARPENREFWLASWRYMQNLSMRATWRTVYEWAKLLLSLSPEEDPYGTWLVLDQYALRARQDLDFLNLSRNAEMKGVHKDIPSIQLSQGFAEWRTGNKGKGQQALFASIGRFPWVVARLMQELGLDPPPGIWGKEPRTEKEKLHSELYVTRAKDLWNTPETSALLTEVASALQPETPSASVNTDEIQQNEARHILLSDTPSLIALVPRKYTTALMSSSDPLPPDNSYPSYVTNSRGATQTVQQPIAREPVTAESLQELQGLYGFFSNLFPWFSRGADGVADNSTPPTEEEMHSRIRESGVDEREFAERTQRMVELQARIADETNFGDAELAQHLRAETDLARPEGQDADGDDSRALAAQDVFGAGEPQQPRVEDAEDGGD